MVDMETKNKIISLKNEGKSNREVARITGLNRETVSKYWEEYKRKKYELQQKGIDERAMQEELLKKPAGKPREKVRRKYTEAMDEKLREILRAEKRKESVLGVGHKQKMTNKQIWEILCEEGHAISQSTVNIELARLRERKSEVYIRQQYEYGDRLEYDFGEVKLVIGGAVCVYHMAVFSSVAGKYRWVKLYTNQKKPVFMDSHVKFLEQMGGCWREIVYDNMKNVVTKFIGKNEKELNEDLVKMSVYYGFKINVTNCFSGHEKGSVEKSVDVVRTELFATNYTFNTLDDAQVYAESKLLKLNENSLIDEEKPYLLPAMPPLELAEISTAKVDKSALISVDTVKYSVPEELVGKGVIVKKYHDEIRVFHCNSEVCRHRRALGNGTIRINVMHYLNTFMKKPGALNNSIALKSVPKLKAIYDTYYSRRPREFIEILQAHKSLEIDEIIEQFQAKMSNRAEFNAITVVRPISSVDLRSRSSMADYASLIRGGVRA